MKPEDIGQSIARDDRLSGRVRRDSTIDPDIRSEYERDVDRVMYNYFFRRLAEITQVSSGHDKILRHNRMTHSLKVAQVGRRLTQYLQHDKDNAVGIAISGGIDHNVVTAAGLLHDVGHPPFGHIGEMQLNNIALSHQLSDGFEGNAQTLRIILSLTTHLSRENPAQVKDGLDLTAAVVAACVKYPWSRQKAIDMDKDKWGFYHTEADLFNRFVVPSLPGGHDEKLEAQIMNWADDITYAVHDLQDFYTDGVIPLHHLRHQGTIAAHPYEFQNFWLYATTKLRKIKPRVSPPEALQKFIQCATYFPETNYGATRKEVASMGALASRIITDASKATSVTPSGRLHIEPEMEALIESLKQITWYYVIDHPDLVSTQLGQRAQINNVFGKLNQRVKYSFSSHDKSGREFDEDELWVRQRRLPPPLRELTALLLKANHGKMAYPTREQCYARAVIDYIASMTEIEFRRIQGRIALVENYEHSDDDDMYNGEESSY